MCAMREGLHRCCKPSTILKIVARLFGAVFQRTYNGADQFVAVGDQL